MAETNKQLFTRLPRNVIALGQVSLFNDTSSELTYPLLPLFLTGTLGASAQFVVFTLTLFDNNFKRDLAVLLLFMLGNSSDAFLLLRAQQNGASVVMIPIGRKRLIVGGWLVYAAIYFSFALATTRFETWLLFIIYGSTSV